MELAENGNLRQFISKHKVSMTKKIEIIRQISSAMEYLHSKGIIHRDLKLENVLIDGNETVKLMDFGLSKIVHDEDSDHTLHIGTSGYIAPEVFSGNGKYTNKCDIFSAGFVFHEIMTGSTPFGSKFSGFVLEKKILDGERPVLQKSSFKDCEFMIPIITSCWKNDPNERMSFKEIVQEIGAKTGNKNNN